MYKAWLSIGAIFGFLGVALGAFGAHALRDTLDAYSRSIYEKAVFYQMFHALALIAVGLLQQGQQHLSLNFSGWSFCAGIVLFSGSLYVLATTGVKWLGAITPFGGIGFLLGWAWMAFAIWKNL
ncbi:MAG: DUF423 domain-containing protein [Calditrichaeota bacterium]|nr:MAG: DUF423 domain-containing protein [Calditrichota bacterium]